MMSLLSGRKSAHKCLNRIGTVIDFVASFLDMYVAVACKLTKNTRITITTSFYLCKGTVSFVCCDVVVILAY